MAHFTDDLSDKLILQGVHVDLTPAMQASMRDKLAVLLRHNEWIVRINVRLHQEQARGDKHTYSATARIEIGGPDIVATVQDDDAYAVIDRLVEKLDEQLRERHERRLDKRKRPNPIELDANLPKVDAQ